MEVKADLPVQDQVLILIKGFSQDKKIFVKLKHPKIIDFYLLFCWNNSLILIPPYEFHHFHRS